MKNYRVIVNGTAYDVAIEEMSAKEAIVKPAAPVAPVPPVEGTSVKAPMPGTILAVNVAVGASVKAGQTLLVLEAMKMENEIVSPCDGKVLSVGYTKGATVESGAVLCVIG